MIGITSGLKNKNIFKTSLMKSEMIYLKLVRTKLFFHDSFSAHVFVDLFQEKSGFAKEHFGSENLLWSDVIPHEGIIRINDVSSSET